MVARVAPRIVAIDPGSERSAIVVFDPCISEPVVSAVLWPNDRVCAALQRKSLWLDDNATIVELTGPHHLAVEMMQARGMPFSNEEMRTLVWLGRFIQAWNGPCTDIFRKDVKMHLCGQTKANDSNIRAAIIDTFGGKAVAVGKKATPGPLYGIKADLWSALAIAITYASRVPAATLPVATGGGRE